MKNTYIHILGWCKNSFLPRTHELDKMKYTESFI